MTMITGKKESIMEIHYKIRVAWDFVAREFTDNMSSTLCNKFRKMETRGDVDEIVTWLHEEVNKSKGNAKLKKQTALRIFKRMLDRLYIAQTLT